MQAHPSSDRRWRTPAAIAVLAAFLTACATSSAFRNGKRAEQNDNYDQAVVEYTKAVRENPDDASARLALDRAGAHGDRSIAPGFDPR